MATERTVVKAADGWVEIAGADEEFLLENASPVLPLPFAYGDEEPAATDPYHSLPSGQLTVRTAAGKVYVRSKSTTGQVVIHSK